MKGSVLSFYNFQLKFGDDDMHHTQLEVIKIDNNPLKVLPHHAGEKVATSGIIYPNYNQSSNHILQ